MPRSRARLQVIESARAPAPARERRQAVAAPATSTQRIVDSITSAIVERRLMPGLLLYAHRDLEVLQRQPWARLDIASQTESRRRPWEPNELQAFFGLPIFTTYAVPTTTHAGADAAYWIPLLGLFTGATVSELAQLRSQDVNTNPGAPTIRITDEGEGMTTKNAYRVREVPMHSELVRLGFLEYADAIKARGDGSLWPALSLRKDKPGGYFSEWFGETRRAAPVNFGKHSDFHCLRQIGRAHV